MRFSLLRLSCLLNSFSLCYHRISNYQIYTMSSNAKLTAIIEAAGEAQIRFLYCDNCPDTLASDWFESTSYNWCLDLLCRGCDSKWSVCRLCKRASRFTTENQMRRHKSWAHQQSVAVVSRLPAATPVNGESIIQVTNEPPESFMMEMQSPDASVHDEDVFSTDNNWHDDYAVTTDDNWIESPHNYPATIYTGDISASNFGEPAAFSNETGGLVVDGHVAQLDFQCLGNEISTNYFKHHHDGHGNSYLVAMSQFNRDNVAPFLDDADVELQMYISYLVDSLTKPQRHHFAEILTRVVDKFSLTTAQKDESPSKRQALSNESSPMRANNPFVSRQLKYPCDIPRSYKEIRAWILEGKYYMFHNLPRPLVHKVGDHACVSIKDCIADMLGHGFALQELVASGSCCTSVSNTTIDGFSRAQTIIGNAQRVLGSSMEQATVLWLTSWSDDFEPNYSIKANRGSVWIKTITIALPTDKANTIAYTYPVALGPKGVDHDVAERFLLSELKLFMEAPVPVLYSGRAKTMTPVYMETFASLQDQPERRDMLFLARGNATYHSRWGYAMDCPALKNVLPPCTSCLESLKKEARDSTTYLTAEWRTGGCDICSCWAFVLPGKHLRFTPPKGYPADKIPDDGVIPATHLSFPLLRQVVDETHQKVINNSWTDKEAEVYLRVHCLSTTAYRAIIAQAKNCSLFEHLESLGNVTSDEYIALSEEKSLHPELYQKWALPSLWNDSIPLERYGDVPMHLLFLGVAKSLVLDIQGWLKAQKQHSSFVLYASNVLSTLYELKLGWCKVLPSYSSGKFGGWVSENYLALVRIFKWIYAPIQQMDVEDTPFVLPETPQRRWTKDVNVKWLRIRGLNTLGSALQVRERVAEYLSQPVEEVPVPIPPRGGTGKQLLRMLNRFSDLVCLLMDKHSDDSHVRNVEVYVRVFLSEYAEFAEQLNLRAENGNPAWIAKYNFMSLLNLSQQIEEVGPLRTLWEGGTRGEGYLRHVKPQMKTGLKTNWQCSLMQTLLRSKSMATLTQSFTCRNIVDNSQHRVYTSEAHLRRMWMSRKPLSIVVQNDVEFMAAYQGTEQVCWMSFLRLEHVAEINEMSYFYFSCNGEVHDIVLNGNSVGAVLLPRLAQTGLPKTGDEAVYSCIRDDWRLMVDSSGHFLPISRHSV